MTQQPQQQNPNELLLITREELERCCSQMSAAGYKLSANYVEASVLSRSRPAPSAPTNICRRHPNHTIGSATLAHLCAGCGFEETCGQHQPPATPATFALYHFSDEELAHIWRAVSASATYFECSECKRLAGKMRTLREQSQQEEKR